MLVALTALLAVEARVGDPLDTDALAKLDGAVGGVLANGDDFADTLVATDERRHGLDGPVTERGVQICVADTGAEHLEETFAGGEVLWRLHGVVLISTGAPAVATMATFCVAGRTRLGMVRADILWWLWYVGLEGAI